jgi:hypothetical protein
LRAWQATAGWRAEKIESDEEKRVAAAIAFAEAGEFPSDQEVHEHVFSAEAGRTLTYAEAVFEATRLEMARDPDVFVMGQGVDDPRGMFGTTLGLHKEFGPERNFDVPLSEDAMTGVGIGAALLGMRPIQVHQRMDFVLLCMNQLRTWRRR